MKFSTGNVWGYQPTCRKLWGQIDRGMKCNVQMIPLFYLNDANKARTLKAKSQGQGQLTKAKATVPRPRPPHNAKDYDKK